MSCKRLGQILVLFVALLGCSHQSTPVRTRIAILRFENLTPDVSLDWMGRAVSEMIAREIGGHSTDVISASELHANALAQARPITAPGESAEREAAIADGATRIVMGQISLSRNQLMLDITERDAAAGTNITSFTLTSPDPGAFYVLADVAARKLSPQVTAFDSKSGPAITSWARAIEETDFAKANAEYASAVQADPTFADAWLAWARSASTHGERGESERILSEAQQHANGFSELNRARLKLAAVQLAGDQTATLAALQDISRLLPDDVDIIRAIADQGFASRQFRAAAPAYRRLTQINPADPQPWNQLGYTLMYAGDFDGAMSALATYQRLAPQSANPIDSQGDVAFAFGRFADAEKLYLQVAAKDPAFDNSGDLYKAAEARLMTGDIAGAAKAFEAYAAARRGANDPLLPFRAAQWLFLSGKHDQAWSALAKLGSDQQTKAPQLRSLALTQMAIWDLQLGRRDRALQESNDALKTGTGTPNTLVARFAADDAKTAADWSARADRLLGSPQMAQIKPVALAYALYFAQQWQAAEPVWKQLMEHSSPDDSLTPVIYASILMQLNRQRDAEPFVHLYPLPRPATTQEFLSLAVPRIFEIHGALLAAKGKTAEAESSRKVFKTLWGAE